MADDILTALAAAGDPAEKAALIAEYTMANLPPVLSEVARRAAVLRWFNPAVLAALLPANSPFSVDEVYRQIATLPFIETLPSGLAFHDLTRRGLLIRYTATQPALIQDTADLAAPVYAAAQDHAAQLEALYNYILADNRTEALNLLETLIFATAEREDWQALLGVFEACDEAERWSAAEPLPRKALHYFAKALANQSLAHYEAALADYGRAIELNPEDATAFYNTACAYALQSDIEAALPPLRRALELDPDILNDIPTDTDFDPIRDDSRFQALLAEFQERPS